MKIALFAFLLLICLAPVIHSIKFIPGTSGYTTEHTGYTITQRVRCDLLGPNGPEVCKGSGECKW